MIRAILFDFGGVLASEGFQDYISSHVAPYHEIEKEISDMENSVNRGDLSVAAYDDFLAAMTKKNAADIDKELLVGYVVREDMLVLVNTLHKKHIKVAILSNFPNEWFEQLRKKFHLDNFFDAIFVSSQFHLIKPQPEFFQEALSRLDVAPNDVVFVDDRAPYIEIAQKLGIHGIVFTSPQQLKKDLLTFGVHV